jgi:hypothetical protein
VGFFAMLKEQSEDAAKARTAVLTPKALTIETVAR